MVPEEEDGMSADEKTAKDLVETLKDDQKGFAASAENLARASGPSKSGPSRRSPQ